MAKNKLIFYLFIGLWTFLFLSFLPPKCESSTIQSSNIKQIYRVYPVGGRYPLAFQKMELTGSKVRLEWYYFSCINFNRTENRKLTVEIWNKQTLRKKLKNLYSCAIISDKDKYIKLVEQLKELDFFDFISKKKVVYADEDCIVLIDADLMGPWMGYQKIKDNSNEKIFSRVYTTCRESADSETLEILRSNPKNLKSKIQKSQRLIDNFIRDYMIPPKEMYRSKDKNRKKSDKLKKCKINPEEYKTEIKNIYNLTSDDFLKGQLLGKMVKLDIKIPEEANTSLGKTIMEIKKPDFMVEKYKKELQSKHKKERIEAVKSLAHMSASHNSDVWDIFAETLLNDSSPAVRKEVLKQIKTLTADYFEKDFNDNLITALEKISKNDPYQTDDGKHPLRERAKRILKKIEADEESKN